jgi:hypothetical protein
MCSSEFEWRDGKPWLHDGVGNVVEGVEVDNPELGALAERHGLRETDLFWSENLEELETTVYGIDLAVSILDGPELSEHRRKELALARLMAVSIGVMLYTGESDLDIRVETAKDLIREFKHTYPELLDEWNGI